MLIIEIENIWEIKKKKMRIIEHQNWQKYLYSNVGKFIIVLLNAKNFIFKKIKIWPTLT